MEENAGSTCHSLLKYEADEVYIFSNKNSCITFLILLLTFIIQHTSLVSSKLDIMYLRYLQSIIRKNKFCSSQQHVATTLPRPNFEFGIHGFLTAFQSNKLGQISVKWYIKTKK